MSYCPRHNLDSLTARNVAFQNQGVTRQEPITGFCLRKIFQDYGPKSASGSVYIVAFDTDPTLRYYTVASDYPLRKT
jgi:hypothetical protein